ncbi:hypothetical protein [uncultured Corynebacterium sp.]|uniref:hypothetical protein n=1 Tax=uncultured Corynebacterium sp. TaxID=159447 RepID=UPI0025CD2865|nr:hypothetical protein [uncultured Corynebacterium sp.]
MIAGALALGGCTIPDGAFGGSGDDPEATGVDADAPDPTMPEGDGARGTDGGADLPATPPDEAAEAIAAELDGIVAAHGAQAGVAWSRPGVDAEPRSVGTLLSDVAWSTSKVPVAIASVRATGSADDTVRAALTSSDNAAAEALWASLGDPYSAAAATDAVLRDGGDLATTTNPERTRPEYTAFGQTQWALPDQATFGANLTCIEGSDEVVEAMGAVVEDQSYGLGTIPGARFKGGWGPDPAGAYIVRQFGTVQVPDGELGLAVAVRPADGTYETGRVMLSDIAAAIQRHMPAGGTC